MTSDEGQAVTRGAVATVLVAVLTVVSGLENGFAYDDVALLVDDPQLHSLDSLRGRLAEPWWYTGLFRPVSLAWLSLQWIAGNGAPIVFRIVSTILYAATSLALFQMTRYLGAGTAAALLAALLFAVHPVHVEVTANTVGQAEMLAALCALIAVAWYVQMRRGGSGSWRHWGGLTVLFALSANSKEVGYVLPLLLLAAEVLIVPDPRPWKVRARALRPLATLLLLAATASLLVRDRILGALGGETPHPSLLGLSGLERSTGMLAIVPEWGRLLFWPARLQAEYGPPGLIVDPAIGPSHLLGLALVATWAVALGWSWRREPVVAFGLAWTVITLAPVMNVLAPTGILLAERTLFLPSAGLGIVVAGLASRVIPAVAGRSPLRVALLSSFGLMLLLGGARSAARQPAWRDSATILEQTTHDAPDSYRAFFIYARELQSQDRLEAAEAAYRRSIGLWDHDPRPFEDLGQLLRRQGRCTEAIPTLQRGLNADSTSDIARSRLVECLIVEREWDAAEHEILRGLAQGVEAYELARRRVERARSREP